MNAASTFYCNLPSCLDYWVRLDSINMHKIKWDCQRFNLLSLCYCRLLRLLYKAPLVYISPFERLFQNLTSLVAENLIFRLSLLIANLFQFVLVLALIFIIKTFSYPLVFTFQWSVYQRHHIPLPVFVSLGKTNPSIFVFSHLLSFLSLTHPPSPVLHLVLRERIFLTELRTVFSAHLHLGFKSLYL